MVKKLSIRLRQEDVVRTLRRRGMMTVDALADELGVSRRTVLRDINALRADGFVINSDVGRGGGLQLDPQSVQTSTRLSVSEIFALVIGVAAMRAAGNLPFSDLADAGLAKIEKGLSADKVKDLRSFLDCLHIDKISPFQDLSDMGAMDPDLLPVFETTFLERKLIHFGYTDANGQRTVREVEPQAMLILSPLWYLVAWDPSRQDFRHFRMDRIRNPKAVLETHFRRRHVPFENDVCHFSELQI